MFSENLENEKSQSCYDQKPENNKYDSQPGVSFSFNVVFSSISGFDGIGCSCEVRFLFEQRFGFQILIQLELWNLVGVLCAEIFEARGQALLVTRRGFAGNDVEITLIVDTERYFDFGFTFRRRRNVLYHQASYVVGGVEGFLLSAVQIDLDLSLIILHRGDSKPLSFRGTCIQHRIEGSVCYFYTNFRGFQARTSYAC